MGKMTLNSNRKSTETAVSNIFLDTYMSAANGDFVKVYLYLLRCMNGLDDASVAIADIADRLNLTEGDVKRALKYWDNIGVLDIEYDETSEEPTSIVLPTLDAPASRSAEKKPVKADSARPADMMKKSYSPSDNTLDQAEFKEIVYFTEQLLGKQLSRTDVDILASIHDYTSVELMEYLVEYCVSNGKKSLRYMDKVAQNWCDEGIKTAQDAKNSSSVRTEHFDVVAKAFGLTGRTLLPLQMEFINRWYEEFGFSSSMISEACKRTVLALNKANFSYANGILEKWLKEDVHNLEDLEKLDKGFKAKKSSASASDSAGTSGKQAGRTVNQFTNYTQRSYDDNELNELEKKLIN